MRLQAQAKMGYYPTPESVTPIIAGYLKRERQGLIRIIDPCAGEGTAVKIIGRHLDAQTYGVELDADRGKRAKQILDKCLVTDFSNTRITKAAFSLLYLNPPYDWEARNNDLQVSERYERSFLRDGIPFLCPGGILVYLIPQRRLDASIRKILSYRFENVRVFRFPDAEYAKFKQIVLFGNLKPRPSNDAVLASYLKDCEKGGLPALSENPTDTYAVPISPSKPHFVFQGKEIDQEELSDEVNRFGLFDHFDQITAPVPIIEKIKPVMPLRHGHLAQVLACGMVNGVVWDREGKNPLLVKGVTKKEVRQTVEAQEDVKKHIETDLIKIVIHAFDLDGNLITIKPEECI